MILLKSAFILQTLSLSETYLINSLHTDFISVNYHEFPLSDNENMKFKIRMLHQTNDVIFKKRNVSLMKSM